ncbi:hypothetical protein BGI51_15435 [Pseudomonas oryzihabitans]|jgi:hypothetical protein|nr:hypothetical protein BGI51_15435 [Pseudomonas psychrotolerans]
MQALIAWIPYGNYRLILWNQNETLERPRLTGQHAASYLESQVRSAAIGKQDRDAASDWRLVPRQTNRKMPGALRGARRLCSRECKDGNGVPKRATRTGMAGIAPGTLVLALHLTP